MKLEDYVRTPDITVFKGFKVTKETNIAYKSKNGRQKISYKIFKLGKN